VNEGLSYSEAYAIYESIDEIGVVGSLKGENGYCGEDSRVQSDHLQKIRYL